MAFSIWYKHHDTQEEIHVRAHNSKIVTDAVLDGSAEITSIAGDVAMLSGRKDIALGCKTLAVLQAGKESRGEMLEDVKSGIIDYATRLGIKTDGQDYVDICKDIAESAPRAILGDIDPEEDPVGAAECVVRGGA